MFTPCRFKHGFNWKIHRGELHYYTEHNVLPIIKKAVFKCKRCNAETTVEQINTNVEVPVECASPNCRRTFGFELLHDKSEYEDTQIVSVQENPRRIRRTRIL